MVSLARDLFAALFPPVAGLVPALHLRFLLQERHVEHVEPGRLYHTEQHEEGDQLEPGESAH